MYGKRLSRNHLIDSNDLCVRVHYIGASQNHVTASYIVICHGNASGIFSGLTLGLLSLDTTTLQVMQQAGTPSEQKNAKKIMPLVRRHHLLLVTLLLANAAAVESMPLFMNEISNEIVAIVVSVTAVLLFGE